MTWGKQNLVGICRCEAGLPVRDEGTFKSIPLKLPKGCGSGVPRTGLGLEVSWKQVSLRRVLECLFC